MDEQQNQNEQDLMGYPNVDALVAAKRASDAEAKRIAAENQQLRLIAENRQQVPQRQSVYERLGTEYGVPGDLLRQAIREEAGELVQSAFNPIAQGFQARNKLMASYSDYAKYEPEVASFIQSDPEVNAKYARMFAVDPEAAAEYGYLKFGESRRKNRRDAREEERELRNQTASEAQIPGGRSGDTRRRPEGNDDEIRAAREAFQKTGSSADATRYAKARLKNVITDDFLNQ